MKFISMIRRVTFVLIVSAFICSCEETGTKKLVSEFMAQNLNDFDSYKPLVYGKIDSNLSSVVYELSYQKLTSERERLLNQLNDIFYKGLSEVRYYKDQYHLLSDSFDRVKSRIAVVEANFKSRFLGWRQKHSYRSKNTTGGVEINYVVIFYNREKTAILNVIGIDKSHFDSIN